MIEIDLDGEEVVYRQSTQSDAPLVGVDAPADADLEASLVQQLERNCRLREILALPP